MQTNLSCEYHQDKTPLSSARCKNPEQPIQNLTIIRCIKVGSVDKKNFSWQIDQ
jgi:hypothetical protein